MRVVVVALVVGLVASGCLSARDAAEPADGPDDPLHIWAEFLANGGPGADGEVPRIADPPLDGRRVVVAVIDSGVNPFHKWFARPGNHAPGTAPVHAVDTATGNASIYVPIHAIDDRLEDGTWLDTLIEPRTLYRFAGTPFFYYSVLDDIDATDRNGHGSGTAATVLSQEPGAYVVMVQTDARNLSVALDWANAQPWIDIVSMSWGCLANCASYLPFHYALGPDPHSAVSERTWTSGKLLVNSAGNDPTPHLVDGLDGPPWVIAAGGSDPYRKGEAWMAAKQPDVVSNYTVVIPLHTDVERTRPASGTSFAAPTVAGTLAAALLEARERVGHDGGIRDGALVVADGIRLTNADLRDALNQSAVYWEPTDYDAMAEHPRPIDPDDPIRLADGITSAGIPINPAAPWLQMGWGHVDRRIVPTMLDGLLGDGYPGKSMEATAYMQAQQDAREAHWT